MATWNSRGLRGSTLEDMINRTNEKYAENNLALIQKIPTPITPIKLDKETRQITLAYFDQKSTVDLSAPFREYRYALMPRNVQQILFRFRISMSTRYNLWNDSKSRAVSLFF